MTSETHSVSPSPVRGPAGMAIVLNARATAPQLRKVLSTLRQRGLDPYVVKAASRVVVGVINAPANPPIPLVDELPGVERVVRSATHFPLVSREAQVGPSIVHVSGVPFGGRAFTVIAGPCAVENEDMLMQTAIAVRKAGATLLRGGAFKPRTNPYSFQGLGKAGLRLLARAREITGLKVVTELMDVAHADLVAEHVDMFQIGSRNMANFALLKCVGRMQKPVLLKRGMSSKIGEFLMAAEYILSHGNPDVVLCERGIIGFDVLTRNTLDIACVPVVRALSHLPIIVDPSHAAGFREYITPLSRAALAVGADGLIVEVHPRPDEAMSDGRQSITPSHFHEMMNELTPLMAPFGRALAA